MKTLFDTELSSTVSIREGGRTRQASKRQIIVKRTVNKAAEGDAKATEVILRIEGIAQRQGRALAGDGEPGLVDPRQAEIDREIVEAHFKMAREAPEDGQQSSSRSDKNDDR